MTDVETLVELSHRIASAIQRRDGATLGPLIDDGFVQIQVGAAEQDKPAFLAAIASFEGVIDSLDLEQIRVRLVENTAIVTGVQRAVVRLASGPVQGATAFVDVFVRRSEGWRIVLAFGADLPDTA